MFSAFSTEAAPLRSFTCKNKHVAFGNHCYSCKVNQKLCCLLLYLLSRSSSNCEVDCLMIWLIPTFLNIKREYVDFHSGFVINVWVSWKSEKRKKYLPNPLTMARLTNSPMLNSKNVFCEQQEQTCFLSFDLSVKFVIFSSNQRHYLPFWQLRTLMPQLWVL